MNYDTDVYSWLINWWKEWCWKPSVFWLSLHVLSESYKSNGNFASTILLECKTSIWCLNMWVHLKFTYEALDHTRLLWTGPCRAKPWPASPNCHVRSPVFWDIMHHWVVIPYWNFGTTYLSHLQGLRNPKEQSTTDVNWHSILFWKLALFSFIDKEAPDVVDHLDWSILSHWAP